MKIQLFVCSLLLSATSFAQFSKGDHLFSGSFGLNSNSSKVTGASPSDLTKGSGLSINLSGSTFSDNLVRNTLGFYFSHNGSKQNLSNPANKIVNSNLAYGISFSRARLLPIAKSLYLNFPVNINAGFTYASTENGGGTSETRTNGFVVSAGISAGLLYQLNKRWVLTLSLPDLVSTSYTRSKGDVYIGGVQQNQTYRSKSYGLNTAIGSRTLGDLSVGFGYLIPRKK